KFDLICLISNEKFILNLIDLHQAYFLNKEKLKTNIFVIDECIKNFESSKSQYIEIRSNYEQIILNIKRIVYVESYGHNVIIHTENGEFKSKKKLSELLNQIEYFDFIQIHKSYVVNEEFINSVSSKCVILNNLIELPLGRKYSKNVKKILLIKRRK
ncbi:LytTR family transcriptional regulator, partial [Coprobacillus sp. AF18-15LB]